MQLLINTSEAKTIEVSLLKDNKIICRSSTIVERSQAEKLLPLIEKLLKTSKYSLKDLETIKVENYGQGFTNLRLGVTVANTLAYALKIPVLARNQALRASKSLNIITPHYSQEPNITFSKNNSKK